MATSGNRSLTKAIVVTICVAGTLDISDAFLFFGLRSHVPAARILQNIASHVVGRTAAYSGGMHTALLGLALHYLIASCWAIGFILVAQHLRLLFRRPILCGALYGLLIYAVMNYVVLPHTPNPTLPTHNPIVLLNAVLALVIFMGITVAVLNRNLAPVPLQS